MRILLCVHHRLDANSGAPGVTLELASEYRDLGHEVELLSFDALPAWVPAPVAELLFPEAAAMLLARRARGVDVIDATTGDAWLWARLTRPARRPALVTRSHGLEHAYWREAQHEARAQGSEVPLRTRLYHGGWRLREVAASLRMADRCVFMNHADLDYAVARLGVRRARATVVVNGIPDTFQGLPLAELGAVVRIAMIGSWAPRKGVRYAAEALTALLTRRPETRVLVLGTGVGSDEVVTAFGADVRPRVTVVPEYSRANLPRLLVDSHVLLSASLAEGFSVAILEGMAAGLAPVATALPGARELIRDGHNGLLVPPRDARGLAGALEHLVGHRQQLDRLRRAAQADARKLSWRRIAKRNLEVYEAALER